MDDLFKLKDIMDNAEVIEVVQLTKDIDDALNDMVEYAMIVKLQVQKKIDALLHKKFFDIRSEVKKVEVPLKEILTIREISITATRDLPTYSTIFCVALHPHLPVSLFITQIPEQRFWTFNDERYKGEFSDPLKMPIFGWGNSIVEAACDYLQAIKNYKTR